MIGTKCWAIYEGRLEEETVLSDLEKIGYLQEAKQASQSRNYANVVEALKREFDQLCLIFNQHLSKMLAMKPVKNDNKSLSKFLRTIEVYLSLKALLLNKW